LHPEITQPLSVILAQWKKNQQQAKQLPEHIKENQKLKLTSRKNAPVCQSSTIKIALTSLQNSSRFLLGFPLKLSHAPLQVSCPQNHLPPTLLSPFFRRV
jgi:hypothetical protein